MSQLDKDVAALSSATTGTETPNQMRIERPTLLSEWTLVIAGTLTVLLSALFGVLLAFGTWDPSPATAAARIFYLGWAMIVAAGGAVLLIAAVASPYVGHISATVGPTGVTGAIDGGGR